MEKKNMIKKSVIILLAIAIVAAIIAFISYQIKWKDYTTCKTDKFEIKYNKSWKVENDLTETFGKKFSNDNNTVEIYLMKKSELPPERNTAKKMKDECLSQISDDNLQSLSEYVYVDTVNSDEVKVSGLNGYRIDFKIKGIQKMSGSFLFLEDDTYLYGMSLEGEDTETFNIMVQSLKIKK